MKESMFQYNSKEYLFTIGENKYDNFNMIDDATDTDVWFHVENEPSCHVILKNVDKIHDIPRQVIVKGCYLCKINSKAKTKKSTIMYTFIQNVVKTDIIGKVIVTSYWSMNV